MWTPKYIENNGKEAIYYPWDQSSWEWNIDYVTKPIQETKTEKIQTIRVIHCDSHVYTSKKKRQNKQNQWEMAFGQL